MGNTSSTQNADSGGNISTRHVTKTIGHQDIVSSSQECRLMQNFCLVWLDANFDHLNQDFQRSLEQLRHVVVSITTFKDAQECINFIQQVKEVKVFLIISGSLGQKKVPEIQLLEQVEAIYIFCSNQAAHEKWAKTVPKVRGVYTKIESICEELRIDRKFCDRSLTAITFNGIDALFMYTQLLKEAVLDIDDDDTTSIQDLVDYCRHQSDIPEDEIKMIEKGYGKHSPIWWYTAEIFMYSMLNYGLRTMDTEIIVKMGFFMRDLHKRIEMLYQQQQSLKKAKKPFEIFRGQGLAQDVFEKMEKSIGGLMSFNNFLSTSQKREISLEFARKALRISNNVGILFIMTIDPSICERSSVPFVTITADEGAMGIAEQEILFTTHTIFRIDRIQRIEGSNRLYEVYLTLTGNDNEEMNELTAHVRKELDGQKKGWHRLGTILLKLGEAHIAEQLYKVLLERATSEEDYSHCFYQLGWVYWSIGEYEKAIEYHKKRLDIDEKRLGSNNIELANSYIHLGLAYNNKEEYAEALSNYEKALEIQKAALPPNHQDLAYSYIGIGDVCSDMGDYSKALSSYEQSLEIRKKTLPPNHRGLAQSIHNIGLVYHNMGDYSKALSHYQRAKEIWEKSLPPTHPHIKLVNGNIDRVKQML